MDCYEANMLQNFDMINDTMRQCFHFEGIDRVNAFSVIDGYPYLVDDYLENINFRQIDPGTIVNGVTLSHPDTYDRTIVDVNIDHTVPLMGNKMKYAQLIDRLFFYMRTKHHNVLPVLQNKLVVQISYQIENYYTGEILRSAQERLTIHDRDYYIKDNLPGVANNDIDSAIITNFKDSLTSAIMEITHGYHWLVCRLTKIELFYPAVTNCYYHYSYPPTVVPWNRDPRWYDEKKDLPQFSYRCNNLYHFSKDGTSIQLHGDEIERLACENISLVPCGVIKLDRTFAVNHGSRMTFRFNIWKSDIVMIKDSSRIEEILGGAPRKYVDQSIDDLQNKIDDIRDVNYKQDGKLNDINEHLKNTMSNDDVDAMIQRIVHP